MAKNDDELGDWIDAEVNSGGLALFGWGFGAVAAFVLGFASWQYAPSRSTSTEVARLEAPSDPAEVTGSIATADRGQTSVAPSRVVGASRVAPMPLASNETVATSRDIDQLRAELREMQRRMAQIGMAGEGVTRRIDRIEERVSSAAVSQREQIAALMPPPQAAAATSTVEAPRALEKSSMERVGPADKTTDKVAADKPADDKPTAVRTAERLPVPIPKPTYDIATAQPPTPGSFDADGPATTGAVPKSTIEKPEAPRPEITASEAPEPKPAKVTPTMKPAKVPPPAVPPMTLSPSAAATPPAGEAAPLPAVTPSAPVRVVTAQPNPAAPPVTAPAATPAPTSDAPAAIDLGGYRSLASLRRSWSDMNLRYGDLSKGLEPLARLRETDSGMEARLLAGPFASQTDAAKACMRLKAAGALCTVTSYGGQPITGLR